MEVQLPTQDVMEMRMCLCAVGFASNWLNECILLLVIEQMPCVPSLRRRAHVTYVSSASLANF